MGRKEATIVARVRVRVPVQQRIRGVDRTARKRQYEVGCARFRPVRTTWRGRGRCDFWGPLELQLQVLCVAQQEKEDLGKRVNQGRGQGSVGSRRQCVAIQFSWSCMFECFKCKTSCSVLLRNWRRDECWRNSKPMTSLLLVHRARPSHQDVSTHNC
jgi:hypothetical protein